MSGVDMLEEFFKIAGAMALTAVTVTVGGIAYEALNIFLNHERRRALLRRIKLSGFANTMNQLLHQGHPDQPSHAHSARGHRSVAHRH